MAPRQSTRKRIPVGISSCLLGHKVRHDGGHISYGFATRVLAEQFEFRSFCPEMSAGLGAPRPAIHLLKSGEELRVVGVKDKTHDVTSELQKASLLGVNQTAGLAGYILKKDSPSCGMERVRIYYENGQSEKIGQGIFAAKLTQTYPNLPVEEEGRLMDPVLRENFIQRVYTFGQWNEISKDELTVKALMDFHTRHKFNMLSHSEVVYRQLGPLVANATKQNLQEVAEQYICLTMLGLKKNATRKGHTNVLMHLMGYFKKVISAREKQELRDIINKYRLGQIPLIVPITLLKHYLSREPHPYLAKLSYFDPYPSELSLRNSL